MSHEPFLSRRELLALSSAGVAGASVSGWLGLLARHAQAAAPPARRKACVLLWMDGGRDHHARAWSSVLVGGGVKGGQVVGKTDGEGARVTERPISVKDFMATVCSVLGIDYTKKVNAGGRPIRIVETGERLIREVLG